MRLFVSVPLPPEIKDTLLSIQVDGKRVPPEKLHITLAFLGNTHPDQVSTIISQLSTIEMEPFTCTLGKIEYKQHLTWVTVESPELALLSTKIHQVLDIQEERPFKGHITISRSKKQLHASIKPLSWHVTYFTLEESINSIYKTIAQFMLR